jgi:hypothetical protein
MVRTALTILVALLVSSEAPATEIAGFRLGMNLQEAQNLAKGRGKNVIEMLPPVGNTPRWKNYKLTDTRMVFAFCKDILATVSDTYKSNLHEFTHIVASNNARLGKGIPDVSQQFHSGSPNSNLQFSWSESDYVKRDVILSQYGTSDTEIYYSFYNDNHPCK